MSKPAKKKALLIKEVPIKNFILQVSFF